MLKYADVLISFQEVPNEISLCINITGCKNNCKGCHSPWLFKDIGIDLTPTELFKLIKQNKGITCVCLMGGDTDPETINKLASDIKSWGLKSAWYSGKQDISEEIRLINFDYIKVGPYIQELGGLDSNTTNQIMYKIENTKLIDITYHFKHDFKSSL